MVYNILSAGRIALAKLPGGSPTIVNQSPVESFDVKTDMDWTGEGLLWHSSASALRPLNSVPH